MFRAKYKNYLFIVLAVLFVMVPNIYYMFVGHEILPIFNQIGFLAFSASLLLIPIFFFTRRIRLYFIIMLPFVLLSPLEMLFLYLYKYPITVGILGSILGTNINESLEFMSGVRISGVIAVVLIIPFTILYIYLISTINKSLNARVTLIISILSFFYAGIVYFAPPQDKAEAKKITGLERFRFEKFETRVLKTYPVGIVLTFVKYIRESEFIGNRQELFKNKPIHAAKREDIKEREIYVLMIGETARYNNFSINNYYYRDTTPNLRSIDNLVSYTDVCSLATETRTSIPLMMTRDDPGNYPAAFTLPSIITFFKKSGFESHWISNQNKADINNKTIIAFANESDSVIYINEAKMPGEEKFKYDEELIPVLKDVLTKSKAGKTFIILHTMGSHYRYEFRYPPKFDVFKPSMKGMTNVRVDDPSTREVKTNSYDNSILYTDYFISSVIKAISSYKAVSAVVYISDHGEDLFDDERNLFLHADKTVTKYVAKVPLFIWLSDPYKARYPKKAESLIKNRDKKISAHNLLDSLLDMADIDYSGKDITQSIFSNKLRFAKREIFAPNRKIVDCDKVW